MSALLPPRFMAQPGPVHPDRLVAVAGMGRAFDIALAAGVPLLEGVRRGFAAQGFASGVVELVDIDLGPFGYVMPALSKDGKNAAFYSDIFRPEGITRVQGGALTFGLREDAPFFHCHGLWTEADGRQSGGHMLPDATVVASPATVTAFGLSGAMFVAEPDAEINFTVFGPVAVAPTGVAPSRMVALRPRPNQDFHVAIRETAKAHGMTRGRLRGGVGSTIGVVYEDGRVMPNFATEVYIANGTIEGDVVTIDVGAVDYTGATARGRLKPGHNPVLMTFELVIEAIE